MVETEHDKPPAQSRVAQEVLEREARRRRVLITASLPICILIGVALFSSMEVDSIYIVGGGAVAGLLAWAGLINLIPLDRDSPAYRLLLAGDRTAEEEQAIVDRDGSLDKTEPESHDGVGESVDVDRLAERTEQSSLKK